MKKVELELYECPICDKNLLLPSEAVELHKIAHSLEQINEYLARIARDLEYIRHKGLAR